MGFFMFWLLWVIYLFLDFKYDYYLDQFDLPKWFALVFYQKKKKNLLCSKLTLPTAFVILLLTQKFCLLL